MVGKILGKRYSLIEKIGSGGMALVYKAKCSYLNRNVAVKILKPEFSDDSEFVKRFRIEAQAAASLSHPNIVPIFDVGEEDKIYYIVMEYIDGITLKEYIAEQGPLEWKEAAEITLKICSALRKAHQNKIIHRDIKPQNILMTADGIPKVTDFGIARAATCATMTMKADTVGSVHYSSPEQARGGYTDEKSDIYSLGVTLFEMLTGKPPFQADTAVTIALKHIQDKPPEAITIRPDIPIGLNTIIQKAMQKSKLNRYQSANELMADLERILTDPKAEITKPDMDSSEDDELGQTRKLKVLEEDEVVRTLKKNAPDKRYSRKQNKNEKKKIEKSKSEKSKNAKRKAVRVFAYLVILAVIFGGLTLFAVKIIIPNILDSFKAKQDYLVEDFTNISFDEAKEKLAEKSVGVLEPIFEFNDDIPEGVIISQEPEAAKTIKAGGFTSMEFTVSKGKNEVEIPDVRYKEGLKVEIMLRDEYGLDPVEYTAYDDMVAEGLVIKTEPAIGSTVKAGERVYVWKSLGPDLVPVIVPDLTGRTLEEAKTILLQNHLVLGYMFPQESQGHKGMIKDQDPKYGDEVTQDSPINLYFEDETRPIDGDGGGSSEPAAITETGMEDDNVIQDDIGNIGTGDKIGTGDNIGTGGRGLPGSSEYVTLKIELPYGVKYDDMIRVEVYGVPSNLGFETNIKREMKSKNEFPLDVPIPVPIDGNTLVKVMLDGVLVIQRTITLP